MVITNFTELLDELHSGKTFGKICSNEMVECVGNEVYYDDDLLEYLASIGVGIQDFGVGYAVLNDITNDKQYEVPYEERDNRFDVECGKEIVLFFNWSKIYDVSF